MNVSKCVGTLQLKCYYLLQMFFYVLYFFARCSCLHPKPCLCILDWGFLSQLATRVLCSVVYLYLLTCVQCILFCSYDLCSQLGPVVLMYISHLRQGPWVLISLGHPLWHTGSVYCSMARTHPHTVLGFWCGQISWLLLASILSYLDT